MAQFNPRAGVRPRWWSLCSTRRSRQHAVGRQEESWNCSMTELQGSSCAVVLAVAMKSWMWSRLRSPARIGWPWAWHWVRAAGRRRC